MQTTTAVFTLLLSASSWGAIPGAWYGDLGLGFGFAKDVQLDEPGASVEFDLGLPIVSLAVGRYLNQSWHVELELAYRDNDLETLIWPSAGGEIRIAPSDGVRTSSGHLNVIRDFQLGALKPYFGAGLGAANVRYRFGQVRFTGPGSSIREPLLDDDAWSVAGQLIAGFRVPLNKKLELAFDYRYWHASSIGVTAVNGDDFDLQHTVHSGYAHLRYLFAGEWQSQAHNITPPGTGWTLGASLGGGYAMDAEVKDSLENLDAFRIGPIVAFNLGYTFTPRWRVELEASRRSNDVEVIDFNPEAGQSSASGDVTANSLIVNALYRFRPEHAIRPFLGAGVGGTRVRYDIVTRDQVYVDDTASAPVVQLLAGFDVTLTERLDFVADFRSWFSYWLDMERPDGTPFKTSHWVHSLNLGLRYSL